MTAAAGRRQARAACPVRGIPPPERQQQPHRSDGSPRASQSVGQRARRPSRCSQGQPGCEPGDTVPGNDTKTTKVKVT
jgi:hypothetical protein